MWNQPYPKDDLESGARPLYPMMLESPQLRWAFIRKIYSIVAIQLLLTIAVAAVVVTHHPIATFFTTTRAGLALYIVLIITPFIGICFAPFICQRIVLIFLVYLEVRSYYYVLVFDGLLFVLGMCSSLSFVLLPPEASCELLSALAIHRISCFCNRADLCLYPG